MHSGKFIAERVTANIRDAVVRLRLAHPVVNDRQYRIWRSYAVNAWPTLVLVDAQGYIVGQHAGEATAAQLAPAIERALAQGEAAGVLDRAPLHFPLETVPDGPLAFPQKVALSADASRLALADSGHNRILLLRLDAVAPSAEVEAVAGSGAAGLADGSLAAAAFRDPHGLAFAGESATSLFVADTENHAVRRVDFGEDHVRTLAGTGEQARTWPPAGGPGTDTPLSSPWDVLPHERTLVLAMAGCHQLWRLELAGGAAGQVEPWVGSGAEALEDGPPHRAALAQPSALARHGGRLFVADSESSAIRWTDLESGETGTIVGTGLFDFGDRDGTGDAVRLQHPLGLTWHEGGLLVADTYNGALKRVDPDTRSARTLIPAGESLREPGGLAAGGGRLFVADTNHHRVVVADPRSGELRPLEIRGL